MITSLVLPLNGPIISYHLLLDVPVPYPYIGQIAQQMLVYHLKCETVSYVRFKRTCEMY